MNRFALMAVSVSLAAGLGAEAFAADELFENYSMAVSDQIAEDYYQGQEMQAGDMMTGTGEDSGFEAEETEREEILVDEEHFDEDGKLIIDAFHGYLWGSSLPEIMGRETTPDMEETIQYSLKKVDASGDTVKEDYEGETFDSFGIKGYSICGYDATSFYLFENEHLTGGVYEFFLDDDVLLDVISQCSVAYGQPTMTQEIKGKDQYALWVDQNRDFLFASVSLGILYGQRDSAIIGIFSDGIERTCGISLEDEIAAAVQP